MSSFLRTSRWPLAYLAVMASIALGTGLMTRYAASRACEMDGQPLSPGLRVDLRMGDGAWHAFCSIECARRWLARQPHHPRPQEAVVRDALTGEPLDAYVAFFIHSKLVTNRANGNDIHAFRARADAIEHLRRFGGEEIDDPFRVE